MNLSFKSLFFFENYPYLRSYFDEIDEYQFRVMNHISPTLLHTDIPSPTKIPLKQANIFMKIAYFQVRQCRSAGLFFSVHFLFLQEKILSFFTDTILIFTGVNCRKFYRPRSVFHGHFCSIFFYGPPTIVHAIKNQYL